MQFVGYTEHDPPRPISIPLADEVAGLSGDVLDDWARALVGEALEHHDLDPTRPVGIAGGVLTHDDVTVGRGLPDEWVPVRDALQRAARERCQEV